MAIDIFDKNSILKINLFGGEPLIYDKICELSKYIKQKNFHLTLITNGIALSHNIDTLSKYIDIVGVSLHGLHEMHDYLLGAKGALDKILNNLYLMQKSNCRFGINLTVTAINYMSIIDTVDYLINRGIDINFVALNRYVENKYLDEKINNELKVDATILNDTLSSLSHLNEKYPNMSFKYAVHFPHCLINLTVKTSEGAKRPFSKVYPLVYGVLP